MIVTFTLVSLLFSALSSSFIVKVNDVRGSPRGTPKLFTHKYTVRLLTYMYHIRLLDK